MINDHFTNTHTPPAAGYKRVKREKH